MDFGYSMPDNGDKPCQHYEKKVKQMSKAKRLMELWMTVNRKRKFTVKELAREFGVSSRTILRDLQELGEIGVPLYSEPGPHGGYRVLHARVLPPISFTEEEAIALFFAAHALRHYKSLPFEAEMTTALQKFAARLPGDVQHSIEKMKNRIDFLVPPRLAESPHLGLLLKAATEQQVLAIRYATRHASKADHGEHVKPREIQPVGLFAHNGLWYCPAYCFEKADLRLFRCDRMLSVEAGRSAPLDLAHIDLTNRHLFRKSEQQTVELEIELEREGVQAFEAELWATSLLQIRGDGTGSVRGAFPRSDLPFLARFLLGIGMSATVVNPPELVESVRSLALDIARKYAKR